MLSLLRQTEASSFDGDLLRHALKDASVRWLIESLSPVRAYAEATLRPLFVALQLHWVELEHAEFLLEGHKSEQ